jgi:hypothetical protein
MTNPLSPRERVRVREPSEYDLENGEISEWALTTTTRLIPTI